jgi:hypothetical protein
MRILAAPRDGGGLTARHRHLPQDEAVQHPGRVRLAKPDGRQIDLVSQILGRQVHEERVRRGIHHLRVGVCAGQIPRHQLPPIQTALNSGGMSRSRTLIVMSSTHGAWTYIERLRFVQPGRTVRAPTSRSRAHRGADAPDGSASVGARPSRSSRRGRACAGARIPPTTPMHPAWTSHKRLS